MIAFLGDIHGDLNSIHEFLKKKPFIDAVVQVGDLGCFFSEEAARADGDWKRFSDIISETVKSKRPFKKPVYFCKGNHEDWSRLTEESLEHLNIRYMPGGTVAKIGEYNIGFLGGVYSKRMFHKNMHSALGREKRFIFREDIELLRANHVNTPVDIFVTHIGGAEYLPPNLKGGVPLLDDLRRDLRPKWHIHGHHHFNYYNRTGQNTEIQGLGFFAQFDKSYKIL